MTGLLKSYYGLNLFLFTASISVCTILFGKLEWILTFSIVFISIPFIKWRAFNPTVQLKWILWLFYLPFFLSFCWSFVLIAVLDHPEYYNYIKTTLSFRLLHVLLFFIILIYGNQIIEKAHDIQLLDFLKIFSYGIITFLGIFGLWQIVANLTGIWVPPIGTRGNFYSNNALGIGRVTSLADEPSYLAPFLIDAIFVLIYLKKKRLVYLLFLVLLFSLSFGGLGEIFIISSIYLFYTSGKNRIKIISILLAIVIFIFIFFPNLIEIVTVILQSRKELQSGFDLSQTSRTAMIVYPISKWSEFDIISIFLGYGPGSSKFMQASNPNEAIFVTSNNIYADLIYEEGLVGLVFLIILFVKFWNYFSSFKNKNKILCKLFLIHIILSSLYRADYASSRFIVLFIIIFIFCRLFTENQVKRRKISIL